MENDPLDPPDGVGIKPDPGDVEFPVGWWELIGGTWRWITSPSTPS
ncbi:MAG TPA: hypothetical protein VHG93_04555 [Longimicrobium sp.]|nr:hypothetical protein [Longimicrobium sp.]